MHSLRNMLTNSNLAMWLSYEKMGCIVGRGFPPPLGSSFGQLPFDDKTQKSLHFGGGKPPALVSGFGEEKSLTIYQKRNILSIDRRCINVWNRVLSTSKRGKTGIRISWQLGQENEGKGNLWPLHFGGIRKYAKRTALQINGRWIVRAPDKVRRGHFADILLLCSW